MGPRAGWAATRRRAAVNFNSRSLTLDDEVNVVVFDPDVVRVLDSHFEDDLARAEELEEARWRGRGMKRRTAEALPGVLARHL